MGDRGLPSTLTYQTGGQSTALRGVPITDAFEPRTAQRGISLRPREHLILAALTFAETDVASCRAAVDALRLLVAAELAGNLAPTETETGELGFLEDHYEYRLLVTVGFSTIGYDKLGGTDADRPRDLQPIPPDVLDASGAAQGPEIAGEGDVIVHIAADDSFITEHVLRRIEHELAADFTVLWVQTGAQRYRTRQSQDPRKESRALIGFLDGTNNLSMANADDRGLVFTDHTRTDYPRNPLPDQYQGAQFPPLREPPTQPEAAILDGGSYMDVEVLLLNTGAWDQQPMAQQEAIVGRHKMDGSLIEPESPDSHVEKANPHRGEGFDDEKRRMLRRGYSLLRPYGSALGRGLIFIAFGRSLSTQAEFVRRAWINNDHFPSVGAGKDQLLFGGAVNQRLLVGGYYFVPPIAKHSDPVSWVTPAGDLPPAT